jgi:hypothetical protein
MVHQKLRAGIEYIAMIFASLSAHFLLRVKASMSICLSRKWGLTPLGLQNDWPSMRASGRWPLATRAGKIATLKRRKLSPSTLA